MALILILAGTAMPASGSKNDSPATGTPVITRVINHGRGGGDESNGDILLEPLYSTVASALADQTSQFFSPYQAGDTLEIRSYFDQMTVSGAKTIEESQAQDLYTVTVSLLNCRSAADPGAAIVADFSRSETLAVLEKTDNWYYVTDGNITGWCYASYLAPAGSADEPAVETFYTQPESYTDDELYWLALAITMEAGSEWISDEHQLLVGNVVLNRVASSRFPNTIYDVLHQSGQYPWVSRGSYAAITDRAYANAQRLLDGERLCPEDVVFQAEFVQGSSIYTSIYDSTLNNTTYFCYL